MGRKSVSHKKVSKPSTVPAASDPRRQDRDEFLPTNLLSGEIPHDSEYREEHLPLIRAQFGFDDNTVVHIPAEGERADWRRPGWIVLYEYPFMIGLRFPLPELVVDVLRVTGLAMAQILPGAWRIIMSAVSMNEDHGADITLGDLGHLYSLRGAAGHRMTLRLHGGCSPLVRFSGGLHDRPWVKRFIFVKRDTLPLPHDFLLDTWRVGRGIPQPVLTPDAEEAQARLYFLSEELRIFPDVLGDRFKASVIFAASHDRGEEEGDSEEPTTHPELVALPSLSESVSMSTETSKTRSKPSGLDLLMRKRRSGSTESSPAKKPDVARKSFTRSAAAAARPIIKPPIPAAPAAGLDSSIPVAIEDDYDIHLPAGYGTNSSSLFPEMDQLLLPNFSDTLDKRRLGEILDDSCMLNFRALQDSLYLRQGVRTVQRDMIKYKKEAASHKAEADALRKEKEAGDAKLAVLQDQLSRIQGVNVGYIAGLQKAKARIQELKEQSVEVGTYYAWETKIQCLEAYHSGEMATWNLEEERAEFNRVYQDKPEVGVYSDEEGEEETTSPPSVEVAVPSDAQEVQPAAPVEVQPVSNVPVEHEENEGGEEVVAAEVAVEEFPTELK